MMHALLRKKYMGLWPPGAHVIFRGEVDHRLDPDASRGTWSVNILANDANPEQVQAAASYKGPPYRYNFTVRDQHLFKEIQAAEIRLAASAAAMKKYIDEMDALSDDEVGNML